MDIGKVLAVLAVLGVAGRSWGILVCYIRSWMKHIPYNKNGVVETRIRKRFTITGWMITIVCLTAFVILYYTLN